MVHITPCLLARPAKRVPKASKIWKRLMYRRITAKYFGRKRNCFAISVKVAHRALRYSSKARKQKKLDMKKLWNTRIIAACREHDMDMEFFMQSLAQATIHLNRKVLADLAIYEPRTFQSLVEFVKMRSLEIGLQSATISSPHGILTRGMLKSEYQRS